MVHNSDFIGRFHKEVKGRGGDLTQKIRENQARVESLRTLHERSAEVFLKVEEVEELQSKLLDKLVQEDHPALESLRQTV